MEDLRQPASEPEQNRPPESVSPPATTGSMSADAAQEFDRHRLGRYMQELHANQSPMMAIIGGTAAALLAASLWAVVTYATNREFGIIAVAVGIAVGYAVRVFGKGYTEVYGLIGGTLALLGCVVGKVLTILAFVAKQDGMNIVDVITGFDYSLIPDLMIRSFHPMDLLFYGFAVYEGWKYSRNQVSGAELKKFEVPKN